MPGAGHILEGDLGRLANNPPELSTTQGDGNIRSSNVKDSGGVHIVYDMDTSS